MLNLGRYWIPLIFTEKSRVNLFDGSSVWSNRVYEDMYRYITKDFKEASTYDFDVILEEDEICLSLPGYIYYYDRDSGAEAEGSILVCWGKKSGKFLSIEFNGQDVQTDRIVQKRLK